MSGFEIVLLILLLISAVLLRIIHHKWIEAELKITELKKKLAPNTTLKEVQDNE